MLNLSSLHHQRCRQSLLQGRQTPLKGLRLDQSRCSQSQCWKEPRQRSTRCWPGRQKVTCQPASAAQPAGQSQTPHRHQEPLLQLCCHFRMELQWRCHLQRDWPQPRGLAADRMLSAAWLPQAAGVGQMAVVTDQTAGPLSGGRGLQSTVLLSAAATAAVLHSEMVRRLLPAGKGRSLTGRGLPSIGRALRQPAVARRLLARLWTAAAQPSVAPAPPGTTTRHIICR